jgi:peroxiredoxin
MGKWLIPLMAVTALSACGSPGRDRPPETDDSQVHLPEGGPRTGPFYALGRPAPDFRLPVMTGYSMSLFSGDSVRLSDHLGRVVVLHFWYTECGPCAAEHETLNRVAGEYGSRGVAFFGVNDVDTPATVAAFEERRGAIAYPILFDEGGKVGQLYAQRGWPLHVVIDTAGRVAWWRPGGPIEEDVLGGVIDDVLPGRRPTAFTPAAYPIDPDS